MTKREAQIGEALAMEMSKQFSEMSLVDLLALRGAHVRGHGWDKLPQSLKESFSRLGVNFLKRLSTLTPG